MSDSLKIDFQWLCRAQCSEFDRSFSAEIGVALGDSWLTELEELESRTTRTHVRACTHTLAMWLAGNWWRLRWEPESRNSKDDVDWRIAHSMASAGGGFCWPNIIFASDGESLAVASIARLKAAAYEPLRYLNSVSGRITAAEFEHNVDAFIESVISRQRDMGIGEHSLSQLWSEVIEERRNPELSTWRKMEALCGYDPDDAPASMIETLVEDEAKLGRKALEEVAAYARHLTPHVLKGIQELAGEKKPGRAGIQATLPERKPSWKKLAIGDRPWSRASAIAKKARAEWGLDAGPISDKKLADLVRTSRLAFTTSGEARTKVPVAFRRGSENKVDLFFHSLQSTGRRFAVGRLLGDHCSFAPNERLIPETNAKTSRQQFQRAFAQEFLCPFDALLEKIQTQSPNEEDIEEAAKHFGVSPLMVRTTLVNKGELDREALAWAD